MGSAFKVVACGCTQIQCASRVLKTGPRFSYALERHILPPVSILKQRGQIRIKVSVQKTACYLAIENYSSSWVSKKPISGRIPSNLESFLDQSLSASSRYVTTP